MTIHSLEFFGFAAAVLALYYMLPRQKQNWLLLAASYIFYISISWDFALILLMMTMGNYSLGIKIATVGQTRRWVTVGVAFNIMAWLFFKSGSFFVPEITQVLARIGIPIQTKGVEVILPIGLSFYVLQAISYLVDLFRKQMPACFNFVDFALFLAYFPKLTAGPIERARTFLPKLAARRAVDNDLLARSFTLIIIGLVRKVVIADTLLQAIPSGVFKTPSEFSGTELALWLLSYTFGLYNDFCGYTNIVRGVSGFFGIELSRNFINPFFSRNFSELWTRWHITLCQWLRDYIYFPLSRALVRRRPSRYNPANLILPPLATMVASGMWHDLSLNFLAWGALMGLYLIAERILSFRKPLVPPDRKPVWRQVTAMATVFTLATLSLPFAFMNLPAAVQFFHTLFTDIHWKLPDSRVFIMLLPALWIDVVQYRQKNELVFLSRPLCARALLLAIASLAIFLFSRSRIPEPFIYQGF